MYFLLKKGQLSIAMLVYQRVIDPCLSPFSQLGFLPVSFGFGNPGSVDTQFTGRPGEACGCRNRNAAIRLKGLTGCCLEFSRATELCKLSCKCSYQKDVSLHDIQIYALSCIIWKSELFHLLSVNSLHVMSHFLFVEYLKLFLRVQQMSFLGAP